MTDLRIVDAPVLLQESITDDVKMPTGGLGNFSIRLGDIVWYVVNKENLANKNYVDTSSQCVKDSLDAHIANKANPHQVTKAQVGLGNVDNTADIDKPVSNAVSSAIITATTDMATKAYVNSKDGDLTTLKTADKTNLVKAINEVVSFKADKEDVALSISNLTNNKADKATTLLGYGITDAYTKYEIDTNYGGVKTLYAKNVAAGAGANGWDANLVAYGEITQKQINDGLENIAQLSNIQNPRNGMRVTVKSYHTGYNAGGGTFEYNSSKASINDGGTIFNGWVRIHFLTENLAEWWGAKWDGTDTTEALDKAIIESAKVGKTLYFGGTDRTYTVNTMRHLCGWQPCSFVIQNNMFLRGDGCKIIADNRNVNMPSVEHGWFYRFFCYSTLVDGADLTGQSRKNISITGIDFDTQFDKFADDKHKIGVFITTNTTLENVRIENCHIYNGSSANSIACFNDQYNSQKLSGNWKILGCQLINNGNGHDHSPIYLMCDYAEVSVDVLQQFNDHTKNMWAANAIEIHGDYANVHHCIIDKVGGGIIAGVNYRSDVKGTVVQSNIINTYSGGITLWSGEGTAEKSHEDITIIGNTVRVIGHLASGRRLGIGTGGFGNSATTVKIAMNTITCEQSLNQQSQAIGIDFSFTTAGTGFAQVGLLDITNNTIRGGFGIAVSSDLKNRAFLDINIRYNNIFIDQSSIYVNPVGVHVKNAPLSNTLNNRSVAIVDNAVYSPFESTNGYILNGYSGSVTLRNKASDGITKYVILQDAVKYLDCELLSKITNLHSSAKEVSDTKIKFIVTAAMLKAAATSNTIRLVTLQGGTAITSVYAMTQSAFAGIADQKLTVASGVELLSLNPSIVGVYGLNDAEKSTALKSGASSYIGAATDIKVTLSSTSQLTALSDSAYVEICINYRSL